MLKKVDKTDSYNLALPERLRELRREEKNSQEDLGAALGVTRQTISKYEDGSNSPDWDSIVKIANYYKVTADYLLGLTESKSSNRVVREVSDEIGLSDNAIKILRKKNDKIYTQGLSFLIQEKDMLDTIIKYIWSGFLDRLNQEPGFRDLPKNKARIADADKTLFAAIMQGLGKFKDDATAEHKDCASLVEQILRAAARKYADIPRCQELWHRWGGGEIKTYSENQSDTATDDKHQQNNDYKDKEERAYEAIRKYLAEMMESPKD